MVCLFCHNVDADHTALAHLGPNPQLPLEGEFEDLFDELKEA